MCQDDSKMYMGTQRGKNKRNWLKKEQVALAGVAEWIGCRLVNQKVAGSVPSQGTCLSCRPGPQ